MKETYSLLFMLLSQSCLMQNTKLVSSAILSDVTSPETRSKALAHVGIAFAICFCIGPPIGAYFASRPLPKSMNSLGLDLNVYAVPAFLTLILLVVETAFLFVALPETRGRKRVPASQEKPKTPEHINVNGNGKHSSSPPKPVSKRTVQGRIAVLEVLRRLHFFFLAIFSGVEFTLTFLTFDCKIVYLFYCWNMLIHSHSTRLVQHSEREAYWIHRHRQRSIARRLCSTLNV